MKTILKMRFFFVIALSMILVSCATGKMESIPVEQVVQIQGDSQDKLYVRANNWMVDRFANAESVVQFTDKESGTISGRYLLGRITNASKYGPGRNAFAIIKVRVKDGASKITITPEEFQYAIGNMYTLYTKEAADRDIAALIESFDASMKTKDNDDW